MYLRQLTATDNGDDEADSHNSSDEITDQAEGLQGDAENAAPCWPR